MGWAGMTPAAREILDQLVDAAHVGDLQLTKQRLIDLGASEIEPAVQGLLEQAVIELEAQSESSLVGFHASLAEVQLRSTGTHDPLQTLLAINRLANRLDELGERSAACTVREIALDFSRKLGDSDGAAYIARLSRYAASLAATGRTVDARRVSDQAADLQSQFRMRERRGGFELDASQKPADVAAETDATVEVYYSTHRNFTSDSDPYQAYGGDRSELPHYGVATVSIPKHRDKGTLAFPQAWQRQRGSRSDECFLLKELEAELPAAVWLQRMRRRKVVPHEQP
jgi:hypothetical protein